MKNIILVLFALLSLQAHSQFQLNGELRPRLENRHGYQTLADSLDNSATFISQRTRLSAFYQKDQLKTGISIQDVRTWGSQSQLNATDGLLSIHEAWFEYKLIKNLSLKAGRQELVYNDHRIFGNTDWGNQGRSHDLMLVKFNDSTWTVHTGFAFNQDKEQLNTTRYTVTNSYKAMQFLWINKKINKIDASLLFVNNGIQSPLTKAGIRYNQVTGVHLEYNTNQNNLVIKGYYQSGHDGSINRKNISAFLGGLEYNYKTNKNISLAIGFEHLCGQSQTDTSKSYTNMVHYFTPLYGTGHKFNGYMDYFYAGNSHGNVGLRDFYLRFKFQREKFFIFIEPHYFMSAANVLDNKYLIETGQVRSMEKNLGTEIDLSIGYSPSKLISFKAGYSQMFGTSTLETIKGGDKDEINNWAYFMITVKPEFIVK
ncbi:MAG TPA: alginate export family protein [Bacteroidia bacterium]|nr:alginate export family protein [Bacteroidia bacterium]